jgi:rsbT co-antagonist protein RsbR
MNMPGNTIITDVYTENEHLRQRIADLEQEATDLDKLLKETVDKQQENEDLLQLVIKYNPNAIAVFDTDLHYIAVSDRYLNDYNIVGKPVLSRHHYDVFPEIPQRWRDVHQRCLAGAIEGQEEDMFVRQDGAREYNRWECRPWYNASGTIGGIITFTEVITKRKRIEESLKQMAALVENSTDFVGFASLEGPSLYLNPAGQRMMGLENDEAVRQSNMIDFVAPQQHDFFVREVLPTIQTQGYWRGEIWFRHFKSGAIFPTHYNAFLMRDSHTGEPFAVGGVVRDISEQKQQEQEHAALQQQIIATQQAAIAELSTPLLPLADGVVALPLVGTLDSRRAQQVMETLLEGIAHYRATIAIVDITGVQMVDTQVAQALIHAAQAVRLLGAQVVLTGIQPQIAQTLVHLGADLSDIITRSNLQKGIAYALNGNTV